MYTLMGLKLVSAHQAKLKRHLWREAKSQMKPQTKSRATDRDSTKHDQAIEFLHSAPAQFWKQSIGTWCNFMGHPIKL